MWRIVTAPRPISIKGLYSFYYFEKGSNFIHNGEAHNFWEINYVDKGELFVTTDRGQLTVPQGNIIFYKPMSFHALSSKGMPNNILVTSFECHNPTMKFFENRMFVLNNQQKKLLSMFAQEMRTIFPNTLSNRLTNKELFEEDSENKMIAYQQGLSYFEQFLIDLIRKHKKEEQLQKRRAELEESAEAVFVSSVQEHLKNHLTENITLADLCTHFNVSKSYLCRYFKEETGSSVIDYLIDLKIKEAKILIRKGDFNFSQIAEMLGYSGIHHFTRSFKSKTGMSPSSYEKSISMPI